VRKTGKDQEKAFIQRTIIKNIAFFGDADVDEKNSAYQDAFEVAKLVAGKGYTIVNGGGPGVMYAATKGAEAAGGETLSVTFYPHEATGFEGKYLRNLTDKEIKTQNYIERMFKLIEHGDLFVIFRGGTGTMSEFATVWVLAKLYYGHHKPFILFGDFWADIIEVIRRKMYISREELSVFEIVGKREEVLPTIMRFEEKLHKINLEKLAKK
jgi:uncharacterized protein (TIGR00730 family)